MQYLKIALLALLTSGVTQAQTLTSPSQPAGTETHECTSCSPDVVLSSQPAQFERSMRTSDLPEAPSATVSIKPDSAGWNLTTVNQPEAPPQREPVWDKKTWAAHMFLAGSMIFDVETTHQGLAHHQCIEGNSNLAGHPSRSELYLDNLEQFAPMVVMDWLGSATLRAGHLPRWAWKSIGYAGPIYGGFRHIQGGIHWYTRCW